jgi:hypothetical protein
MVTASIPKAEAIAEMTASWASQTFYQILLTAPSYSVNFTVVTPASGILSSPGHNLINGVRFNVSNSGGALPTGLSPATTYYVASANIGAGTFVVADADGNPIVLSSSGSGTNTFVELAPGPLDSMAVLVRNEVASYNGSGRQAVTFGSTVSISGNQAIVAPITVTVTPSTAFGYRYAVLGRGATGTLGDTTGTPAFFGDEGTTITIDTAGKQFQYAPKFTFSAA